jgi:two-component system nitrogen regulation sensor histidine kinase NtrY
MTEGSAAASTTFATRFLDWARRTGLSRKLAIALAVAAVASGAATYGVITDSGFAPNPRTVLFLLILDLILLLLLGAVVAWRIVRLWAERRRGMAGSKLHVELVVLFSALAVAPTVVMAVFSTLFFNLGVEAWFSERVKAALKESMAVAQAYLSEHGDMIRGDILAMSADLNREEPQLIVNRRLFQQRVTQQAYLRTLQEAVVFDEQGQTIASANFTASPQSGLVPFWALNRAHDGELVLFDPDSVEGTVGGSTDRVRALIKLDAFDGLFLMVGRLVDPRVIGHLERTLQATQAYESIEGQRSGLELTFAMIFGLVALLLLFSAVWVGLVLANRLARPIAELVGAAERVRSGDLGARVGERERSGEIGSLSRAFNRMASQLENQRRELVEANRQLDHRRRFTEAVLSGVSSGVIGLDAEGRINLPNRSASDLLSTDLDRLVDADFGTIVPEMLPLLEAARTASGRPAEGQVTVLREGRRRTFFVRIAGQPLEDGTRGYVVTFDDITELEAAQRKAAWSDVARRIAHEIKNPLTPIQLSAERLRRKYMHEIKTDPETFRICTETIVRQVGDIGRMVDEFSSFARMPTPSMREDDLAELVRQTVFLQRNARPEITFDSEIPDARLWLSYDPRQIGQALTNLLQNAIDAIDGREPPADGQSLPPGRIATRIVDRGGRTAVIIEDNGKGLPAENRERLTEPYVTTRAKGTGLGLAIVKKIMEDHGGDLVLEDRAGGGTSVSLVFAGSARSDDIVGTGATAHATKAAVHGA